MTCSLIRLSRLSRSPVFWRNLGDGQWKCAATSRVDITLDDAFRSSEQALNMPLSPQQRVVLEYSRTNISGSGFRHTSGLQKARNLSSQGDVCSRGR